MSPFEFLSVLISVVVGLALSHLLTGAGSLLHRSDAVRKSAIHGLWTIFVFVELVLYWWTIVFGWEERTRWTLPLFAFVLGYSVLLYLLCVVLYPVNPPAVWDMEAHFIGMRRWFFGLFALVLVTDLVDTYLKGHFDELGLVYPVLIGSWFLMSGWGWASANPRHHRIIAALFLTSFVAWVGLQFINLNWARPG